MMDENATSAQVLIRLRESGWQQCGFGPRRGPNCLQGALFFTGNMDMTAQPLRIWTQIIGELFPDRVTGVLRGLLGDVILFNDHPDTTFADVELVLEKAIAEEQVQIGLSS